MLGFLNKIRTQVTVQALLVVAFFGTIYIVIAASYDTSLSADMLLKISNERGDLIGLFLDSSVTTASDLDPDHMHTFIQKLMFSDPDVIDISVYTKAGPDLKLIATESVTATQIAHVSDELSTINSVIETGDRHLELIEYDGEKVIHLVTPITIAGESVGAFSLVNSIAPIESVIALRRARVLLLEVGLLIATVAMIALVFRHLILAPLFTLVGAAEHFRDTDFSHRVSIRTGNEFFQLGQSFNEMAASLESFYSDMEGRIQERTLDLAKFKLAVESASEGVVMTGSSFSIIYANPSALSLLGFTVEEIIGEMPSIWERKPGDYYKNVMKSIEETGEFTDDFECNTKFGSKIQLQTSVAPVRDDRGQIIFLVYILRDITQETLADKMKNDVLSIVSHQLRTPLSAIKWLTEILYGPDLGELNPEQKDTAGKLVRVTDRMITLVNDLLNISRIESGRLIINPRDTDVSALIQALVEDLAGYLQEHDVEVLLDVSQDVPKAIKMDPQAFKEILMNLVTNAVKYSKPKGEVHILVYIKDKNLQVKVEDFGYGIPEHEQGEVFGQFYRGANIVGKDIEGSGLGLYLVKMLVETSGGKIWFQSTENVGTTFWISYPLSGMTAQEGVVEIS